MRKILERCPSCGSKVLATRLTCQRCDTTVEGLFAPCNFCRLDDESLSFIETFVRNRGNIKDVERELGISYPTVRSRLEAAIDQLEIEPAPHKTSRRPSTPDIERAKRTILDQVAKKELSPIEAIQRLEEIEP